MSARSEPMERKLARLIEELRAALGAGLKSAVLYGSAARGDHAGAGSDLNVLVVVADDAPAKLDPLARLHRRWVAEGNRPLLVVTPEWIRGSTDVFPMEFLDMMDARRVLVGEDPLAGVAVSDRNLRLQCESELRSKLLKLRAAYLDAHDSASGLRDVIAASYGPFGAVARAALRLAGESVPARSEEVLEAAARRFGMDPAPLRAASELKRGGRPGSLDQMRSIFNGYYAQIEALGRALDAMKPLEGERR